MNELERKDLSPGERSGLVVTNLVKLVGLVAAGNELLLKEASDPKRLALIGVMLTGTQAIESLIKGVFGR